jgi:hypothetical protein
MPSAQVRDAATLSATSTQVAAGLSVAVATVLLRVGGLLDGTGASGSRAAFEAAFWLLALIAVGPAIEALRMRRDAGDAARQRSATGADRGTPGPEHGVPAGGTAQAGGAGSEGGAAQPD